jgi:hypothetical protein
LRRKAFVVLRVLGGSVSLLYIVKLTHHYIVKLTHHPKLASHFLISLQVFSIRGMPWNIVGRNIIADG